MKRGELYRVFKANLRDPKKSRVFVVVSRNVLVDSTHSTVICAPIFSRYDGLDTQVTVDVEEGLKHSSSIHCDDLISLPKAMLTNYVGALNYQKELELESALKIAVGIE